MRWDRERGEGAGGAVPRERQRAFWIAYAVMVSAVAGFLGLVVLAPFLRSQESTFCATVLYQGFGPMCHQMPERSFWLFGAPLAICSRCTSLYAGALLGMLLVPAVRGFTAPPPRRRWLALAGTLALADFAVGFLGILENTFLSRGMTGALLGAISAFYILPGLLGAAVALWAPRLPNGDAHGSSY